MKPRMVTVWVVVIGAPKPTFTVACHTKGEAARLRESWGMVGHRVSPVTRVEVPGAVKWEKGSRA